MVMLAIILLAYVTLQTPIGAAISACVFYLALWRRRTGDEPFAVAVRQPRNRSKPKEWLIAYAVVCVMAGAAVIAFHPWSTDPDPGMTSQQSSKLYASAIAVHGGFFFAYMGWTGTQLSRWVYWFWGCIVVAIFAYVVSS